VNLLTAVQLGIAAILAFAVLAHGAVEPWSLVVVEWAAVALLLLWGVDAARRGKSVVRWTPLCSWLAGLAAFGVLQGWSRLSVYPYLTELEVLKLGTLLVVVFLATQVFRTASELGRLVWFLLSLGFAVALFAIIQFLTFNQKLYWFREVPYGGGFPFGPYVNRNHFAGFLELIIPLGLALLWLRAVKRDLVPLLGLFSAVMVGALFLSTSRGGIASLLFECALLGVYLWRKEKQIPSTFPLRKGAGGFSAGRSSLAGISPTPPLSKGAGGFWARPGLARSYAGLAGALVFVLLAGTFVAWLGVGPALERFGQLASGELTADYRIAMASAALRIFLAHPWLGTGLGTFITVYPQYASFDSAKLVDYAHNDYLQLLAEAGMVGLAAIVAFFLILYGMGLRRLRQVKDPFEQALRLGALVACSGMLLHSLVDFNLHIPANALLFFLLAGIATEAQRH
jgi:O-antigen ligase